MDLALWLARLLIGGAFAWAGLSKINSRRALTDSIREYRLMSDSNARKLAWVLPPFELALGLLLILDFLVPIAAMSALFLLSVFTSGMVINLRRGRRFPCRCFARNGAEIGMGLVVRNIVLGAVTTAVLVGGRSQLVGVPSVGSWGGYPAALGGMSGLIALTVLICLLPVLLVLSREAQNFFFLEPGGD